MLVELAIMAIYDVNRSKERYLGYMCTVLVVLVNRKMTVKGPSFIGRPNVCLWLLPEDKSKLGESSSNISDTQRRIYTMLYATYTIASSK